MKQISLVKAVLLFLICCSCTSCVIKLNGSFRGLYSYYKKTKKESPELFVYPDSDMDICDIKPFSTPKVVVINGEQLKNCLNKSDKAMVFIWNMVCKNKYCYPLEIIQQRCSEDNVDLYVVGEYYFDIYMKEKYDLQRPIYGIDTKYYKSNLTSRYLPRFINDLTSQEDSIYNCFYFEKGTYIKHFKSIYTLDSLAGIKADTSKYIMQK